MSRIDSFIAAGGHTVKIVHPSFVSHSFCGFSFKVPDKGKAGKLIKSLSDVCHSTFECSSCLANVSGKDTKQYIDDNLRE